MTGAAATVTAYKTAVFKIHNPSRRKRAMLDDALRQAHLAYSKALNALRPDLPRLVAEERTAVARDIASGAGDRERLKRKRQRKIERERQLYRRIAAIVRPLPICNGASSVINDLIAQVESHIELHGEQDSVGLPSVQRLVPDPDAYHDALHQLANAQTVEEENAARDRLTLIRKAGQYRPLLLIRNRVSDGFLILRRPSDGRYFIWLNLVPVSSRFARLTAAERRACSCRNVDGLYDVRTGEVMSFRSRTGALFPIAFGRDYQLDEFLAKARPQSAKLVKRDDAYEVHVTFEFTAGKVATQTTLGVDRGIYNLASLRVIDGDGRVLAEDNVDGRGLRHVQRRLERLQRRLQRQGRRFSSSARRHAADEAVHVAANRIVALAAQHRARVVMENLDQLASRRGKRARSSFNRILNRSQYQKLQKVLEYKLAVAGLPPPQTVAASWTSRTCPICGHADPRNRPKQASADGFKVDVFKCVRCRYTDDADLNAARVIALKWMWREQLSPALRHKPFKEVPEHRSFSAFLRDRAERRGERPCDREVGTSGGAGLDGHEDGEVPPGGGVMGAVRPLSLTPDRTPGQTQKSATRPSRLSSSSENLPLPEAKDDAAPDG